MGFGDLGPDVETGQGVKWADEDGDQIEGTVLSVNRQTNKFNADKTDVNVSVRVTDTRIESTENGGDRIEPGEIRMVYGSRGSLRVGLERRNPQPGDTLFVAQEGTYTVKQFPGKEFPNYETAIKRAPVESDSKAPWGETDE